MFSLRLVTADSISRNDNNIPGQTVRPVCATQAPTSKGAGIGTATAPASLNLIYSRA